MKHGEQLAPLIDAGARRGRASSARTSPRSPSASGPGRSPACGSGWSPRARSASSSRSRCTACARSTCSPSRPSTPARSARRVRGGHRRPAQGGLPRVVRRRRRAAGRARSSTSPADVATDAPGRRARARVLYPEAFPHARRPGRARAPAGWPASVAEERAELLDPEPLYLRRPDAVAPGTPKRGLVIRAGRAATTYAAIAGLERDNLGADAWSAGLVARGRRRAAADRALPGGRGRRRRSSGTPSASIVADIAELQRIAVDRGAPAHRPRHARCWTAVADAAPRRRRGPAAARGARGQRGRAGVLRRRRLQSRSTGAGATTATAPPPSSCSCACGRHRR